MNPKMIFFGSKHFNTDVSDICPRIIRRSKLWPSNLDQSVFRLFRCVVFCCTNVVSNANWTPAISVGPRILELQGPLEPYPRPALTTHSGTLYCKKSDKWRGGRKKSEISGGPAQKSGAKSEPEGPKPTTTPTPNTQHTNDNTQTTTHRRQHNTQHKNNNTTTQQTHHTTTHHKNGNLIGSKRPLRWSQIWMIRE